MAEKTDKEWEELSPKRFLDKWQKYVDQGKEAGCKEIEISNEAMDCLISMARKADELEQNLKDITKDPYEVEFRRLEAKVGRYERTIRHITCDTKIINDRISEALEE